MNNQDKITCLKNTIQPIIDDFIKLTYYKKSVNEKSKALGRTRKSFPKNVIIENYVEYNVYHEYYNENYDFLLSWYFRKSDTYRFNSVKGGTIMVTLFRIEAILYYLNYKDHMYYIENHCDYIVSCFLLFINHFRNWYPFENEKKYYKPVPPEKFNFNTIFQMMEQVYSASSDRNVFKKWYKRIYPKYYRNNQKIPCNNKDKYISNIDNFEKFISRNANGEVEFKTYTDCQNNFIYKMSGYIVGKDNNCRAKHEIRYYKNKFFYYFVKKYHLHANTKSHKGLSRYYSNIAEEDWEELSAKDLMLKIMSFMGCENIHLPDKAGQIKIYKAIKMKKNRIINKLKKGNNSIEINGHKVIINQYNGKAYLVPFKGKKTGNEYKCPYFPINKIGKQAFIKFISKTFQLKDLEFRLKDTKDNFVYKTTYMFNYDNDRERKAAEASARYYFGLYIKVFGIKFKTYKTTAATRMDLLKQVITKDELKTLSVAKLLLIASKRNTEVKINNSWTSTMRKLKKELPKSEIHLGQTLNSLLKILKKSEIANNHPMELAERYHKLTGNYERFNDEKKFAHSISIAKRQLKSKIPRSYNQNYVTTMTKKSTNQSQKDKND